MEPTGLANTILHPIYMVLKIIGVLYVVHIFLKRNIHWNIFLTFVLAWQTTILIASILNPDGLPFDALQMLVFNITPTILINELMRKDPYRLIKYLVCYNIILLGINLLLGSDTGQQYSTTQILLDETVSGHFFLGIRTIIAVFAIYALGLGGIYYYLNPQKNLTTFGILITIITAFAIWQWVSSIILTLLLVMIFLLIKKRIKIKHSCYFFFLEISFIIGLTFLQLHEYFSWLIEDILHEDMTLHGRTYIWKGAIVEISKSPWIGFGMVENRGFNVWQLYDNSRDNTWAHSTYLQATLEAGIIGLLFYLCIYLVTFIKLDKYYWNKYYSLIVFMILISLIQAIPEVSAEGFSFLAFLCISYNINHIPVYKKL